MICLVRHGETEFNREARIQGRMESRLTSLGERQAVAMGSLVADLVRHQPPAPWRLVCSPQGRALATARAIGEATGLAIETDDRLMEIACGEWEGRLRSEIAHIHPEKFAGREWFFGAPGGETYEDVMARAVSFLGDLPPEPQRRVIVVSHGVMGRLMRGAYAGLSREQTIWQDVPQDACFVLQDGMIGRIEAEPVEAP